MQVAIPDEGCVTPRAIDRDAQQLGAVLAKLRKHLVVQGHLIAADWAPVRGIEGEDDRRAPQVTERQELVRGDTQGEIGGRGAGGQNVGHVSSSFEPYLEPISASADETPIIPSARRIALTPVNFPSLRQDGARKSP